MKQGIKHIAIAGILFTLSVTWLNADTGTELQSLRQQAKSLRAAQEKMRRDISFIKFELLRGIQAQRHVEASTACAIRPAGAVGAGVKAEDTEQEKLP